MVNLAHIHLLVNHFPTVGMVAALALFITALVSGSIDLKKAGLVAFFMIALLTIPAYISGNAAEEMLRGRTGVASAVLEAHRNAAQLSMFFVELTGMLAWLALWRFRRHGSFGRTMLPAVLAFALAAMAIVGYAANIGGGIRHPEIEDDGSKAAKEAPLVKAKELDTGTLGNFITDEAWVWPTCETLHFIGLSILMGVILAINLRMLGVVKNVAFQSLHRLLPWAILGFTVNLLTGMLFFAGRPGQYTVNPVFHWKIVMVVIAGVNALYFTMLDEAWTLGPGDEAPMTAKVMAGSAMFLWIAILFCGSMLPFLGQSF